MQSFLSCSWQVILITCLGLKDLPLAAKYDSEIDWSQAAICMYCTDFRLLGYSLPAQTLATSVMVNCISAHIIADASNILGISVRQHVHVHAA